MKSSKTFYQLSKQLSEGRDFEEFLTSYEKAWEADRKAKSRSGEGAAPSVRPAISVDDLGGSGVIGQLRNSSSPDAEIERLIVQANREGDYKRADALRDFRGEFRLQRGEINQGLRNSFATGAAATEKEKQANKEYMKPLQSVEVETPAGEENAPAGGSGKGGDAPSAPTDPKDHANVVQSSRDRIKSLKKNDPGNPAIRQLEGLLDQYRDIGKDRSMSPEQHKAMQAAPVKAMANLLAKTQGAASKEEGGSSNTSDAGSSAPTQTSAAPESDLPMMVTPADVKRIKKGKAPTKSRGVARKRTALDKARSIRSAAAKVKEPKSDDQKKAQDQSLKGQVDVASKRISFIRERMSRLLSQLKREKNKLVRERIQKQIAQLDRDLGVAYVSMERVRGVTQETSEISKKEKETLASLFWDMESMSIQASDATGKMPEVWAHAEAHKADKGYTSLEDLFGDQNVKMQTRFGKSRQGTAEGEIASRPLSISDIPRTVDWDKAEEMMQDIDADMDDASLDGAYDEAEFSQSNDAEEHPNYYRSSNRNADKRSGDEFVRWWEDLPTRNATERWWKDTMGTRKYHSEMGKKIEIENIGNFADDLVAKMRKINKLKTFKSKYMKFDEIRPALYALKDEAKRQGIDYIDITADKLIRGEWDNVWSDKHADKVKEADKDITDALEFHIAGLEELMKDVPRAETQTKSPDKKSKPKNDIPDPWNESYNPFVASAVNALNRMR